MEAKKPVDPEPPTPQPKSIQPPTLEQQIQTLKGTFYQTEGLVNASFERITNIFVDYINNQQMQINGLTAQVGALQAELKKDKTPK